MTREQSTADDSFELPPQSPPARGLVPRSGLWWGLALFAMALVAFAIYDIAFSSRATGPSPSASQKNRTPASPGDDSKLGPAPAIADLGKMVDAQLESPGSIAPARVSPSAAAPSLPMPPLPPTALPSAEVAQRPEARAERIAEAAVSRIFANPEGAPNAGSTAGAMTSALGTPRQLIEAAGSDALTSNTSSPAAAADRQDSTASDIMRNLGLAGPLTGPQTSRPARDEAWLRESAQPVPADAARAQPPAGTWMIFQGTRIPVVTREAINSDLPGPLSAMATATVFDSIHQCAALIPAGTRFLGQYSSDIRAGQSRVLVAFRRMILPDGRSVQLTGAQGVDRMGQAGIAGDVDNHFLQMFGYGFAIAWIADRLRPGGSAVTVTLPNGQSTSTTVAGQVLADTGTRILNRNAVIPPTVTVDGGARMYVTVTRDIALDPVSRADCQ